jgi:Arginase/agmatinase/formimionoglutamate hydrolase, arginase family
MKEINFLGLGFEVGQDKNGLKHSHEYVRQYFPLLRTLGLDITDKGAITNDDAHGAKVHLPHDIPAFNWAPFQEAYAKIHSLYDESKTILNWGGDHSVALATVAAFIAKNPRGHVIWIDAHTDINLPEHSLSGNLHGMPLSILLNVHGIASKHFPWIEIFLKPEQLTYVGVRDLDPFEKEITKQLGIETYTTADIREQGMTQIAKKIFAKTKNNPLHVSFDIDSLSPEHAPSTGVPVHEGLTLEDIKNFGRVFSKHTGLNSVDVVEVNPSLGSFEDVFQTYFSALIFVRSLFFEGEVYDGISRSVQTINSASLEPSL